MSIFTSFMHNLVLLSLAGMFPGESNMSERVQVDFGHLIVKHGFYRKVPYKQDGEEATLMVDEHLLTFHDGTSKHCWIRAYGASCYRDKIILAFEELGVIIVRH